MALTYIQKYDAYRHYGTSNKSKISDLWNLHINRMILRI